MTGAFGGVIRRAALSGWVRSGWSVLADRGMVWLAVSKVAKASVGLLSVPDSSAPPITPGPTAAGRLAAMGDTPARAGNRAIIGPL
jgi:hypothetical protein